MAHADGVASPSRAFREAMGVEDDAPARATPAAAFEAARHMFLTGKRLDMVALAAELGVARGTLYRWTGDRDQLLADVVWAELNHIFLAVVARAPGTGRERIEHGVGAFLEVVAKAPALRALLANEASAGLLMLTSPTGPVRPRIIETLAKTIEAEVAAGNYTPPAPPEVLADGIVSLGERFLHNGGDPTLNPDPATAKTIVGLLLREPCEAHRPTRKA